MNFMELINASLPAFVTPGNSERIGARTNCTNRARLRRFMARRKCSYSKDEEKAFVPIHKKKNLNII